MTSQAPPTILLLEEFGTLTSLGVTFAPFTFEVGNFFEPNSLERSVSSAKYRDFIERSQTGDLLAGNRHIGIAAVTGGEAPGIIGKSNWSAKAGIFSTSLEDGAPVAPTVAGGVVTNVASPPVHRVS